MITDSVDGPAPPTLPGKLLELEGRLKATISSASLTRTWLPLCPEISLYLLEADYPRGRLPHDEMLRIMDRPAYWAFCWASGQILARYILDHAGQFSGKRILDLGSGSGVVGIAASLAGAAQVFACDIDPDARLAAHINAAVNGVALEELADMDSLTDSVDWVIAADVLYDRDNFPWIEELPNRAARVLIADSRIKRERLHRYQILARTRATTIPDLDESQEFSDVRVYSLEG